MSDYSLHLKLPFCKYRFECKMQGEMLSTCSNCEHWFECSKFLGYHARRSSYANTVINEYPDGNYEVVLYDREFPLLLEECNRPKSDIPHGRKFDVQKGSSYVEEILIPKKDNVTLFEFCESLERSSQRAQNNFYGYGLSNDWHYFLTLTFSPNKVNRFDDDAVKSLWSNWLQEVRKDNPDIKALVVPERHKNGAIHFHGFLADCPNISLSQAYYPKDYKLVALRGTPIYTKLGDPVFNVSEWTYGFSTVAILPKDTNKLKVVNYTMKYMRKGSDLGYNKKRYYHTKNLDFKRKYSVLLKETDLDGMDRLSYYQSLGFEIVKQKDGIITLHGSQGRLL